MKLSVCMIVKNEEEMLPRCLESIKGITDELIVVDTGSTDKTVEIAESYGAKVYHHPWENDFSLHRNQSLGYATGDWFLIIDADEEMGKIPAGPERFRARFANLPEEVNGLLVQCHEKNNEGDIAYTWDSIRFFRAGVGVYYTGAVHNRAKYPGAPAATDIEMYHYGYHLNEDAMAAKGERQMAMLQAELDENPDSYRALYYMCQVHFSYKRFDEGLECALKCLEVLPIEDPTRLEFYGFLYYSCGMANIIRNNPDEALAWFQRGVELIPDHIDLYHGLSRLAFMCENDDLLKENAEKYFELLPIYTGILEEGEAFTTPLKRMPSSRGIYNITHKAQTEMKHWLKLAEVEL